MIYFLILAANAILLSVYRHEKRYWVIAISIWAVVTSSFLGWRVYNENQLSQLDKAYWQSAHENKLNNPDNGRGDEAIWHALQNKRRYLKQYNSIFLFALLFQTFLTFVAQIIGYKRTSLKNTYKLTSIVFGFLLVICVLLAVLIAIVPGGPLV